MKKAIVVVSFGTSYDSGEKAITHIEERIQQKFPDYDIFRAYTSGMILKKLAATRQIYIDTPEQAMERLVQEGYEAVICQPTHMIHGFEYEKMKQAVLPYAQQFQSFRLGEPLLSSEEDYRICARAFMEQVPEYGSREALILMGHGTDHYTNSSYSQMENMFRYLGYERVYVSTVEGFPDLSYARKRLAEKEVDAVYLCPFMMVAGDHAQNDMASEEEDSWKSILNRDGYQVKVILKGLGELDAVGDQLAGHAEAAPECSNGSRGESAQLNINQIDVVEYSREEWV